MPPRRILLAAAAVVSALLASLVVLIGHGSTGATPETTPQPRTARPLTSSAAPTTPTGDRPNIIFFLVDDLSAELLDYLDTVGRLRDGGTVFTNYFVSNSLCCPSRATTFTGLFPHNSGVLANNGRDGGYRAFRKHERHTYATALHQVGYRTGYLGKYINKYSGLATGEFPPPGWDEWHATDGGYRQFDFRLTHYIREQGSKRIDSYTGKENYLTDVLAEQATHFLKRSARLAPARPFFLQVSTFAPHQRVDVKPGQSEPRFPPAPRDRPASSWPDGSRLPHGDCGVRSCRGIDVAEELPGYDEDTSDKPSWVRRVPLANSPKWTRELREDFLDRIRMVQAIDDMVGTVLRSLTERQRANTYVVFASDNGFHLGQHRLARGKGTAYDHDVRVPLLVKRPATSFDRTVVRDEIVQNVDLFATFLDMAGVEPAVRHGRDGRSLLGLINDEQPAAWRTAALIEYHAIGRHAGQDPDVDDRLQGNSQPPSYRAIRTADELYVDYFPTGEKEYYDLTVDPLQENNKPDHPRIADLDPWLTDLARCGRPGYPDCWSAGMP